MTWLDLLLVGVMGILCAYIFHRPPALSNQPSASEADLKPTLPSPEELESIRRAARAESSPEWWDGWWNRRPYEMYFDHFFQLAGLPETGVVTVLFAGNGCSQEPRFYEGAGYQVDALDISPLATQMAQEYPFNAELTWLRDTPRQPGGRLSFVTGAIEDVALCPGPYDLIISRLCLQYYTGDALIGMCKALKSRLHSEGLIVVQTQNAAKRAAEIESIFQDLGVASAPFEWVFMDAGLPSIRVRERTRPELLMLSGSG